MSASSPNILASLPARLRDKRLARLYALADQGFQGLGSIAATAILGRSLSQEQFGAVGVAIGAYYFVAGFHRSAIILPYLTEHRPHDDTTDERRYHADWWWLSVAASVALAIGLVAIAGVVAAVSGPHQWLVLPLLLGAGVTLPMLAAEFGRRWLYKIERADLAAIQSAIFFCALLGGAAAAGRFHPDARAGIAAWGVAATLSSLLFLPLLRPGSPSWQRANALFAPHARFAGWLSLNIFPYTVYSTATVVLVIGVLLGPAAAAVFTAARTLTNPAVSIVSAIDSTDKPRATRALGERGIAGLGASIGDTRRTLIMMTGGYLLLIALFAGPLLNLVFHGQYPGIEREVQLLCLAFFLFCLNQPSETLLIVLRESRRLFVTRLGTAIVTLVALVVAIPHGVPGMAIAIAVSQLANIVFLGLAERRALAEHRAIEGATA
jgi:O-antigen/teichoic acid export membrane protein